MKANELMIGDCVRHKRTKEVISIFEIDDDRNVINNEPDGYCSEKNINVDDVEPIPLTPEILEKNGFYLGYTSNQEDAASQIHCTLPEPMWTWDEGAGSIQISFPNESDGGEMYLSDQNFDRDLHFVFCENIYVHELQHAIRLCGIDKEIEL